MLADSLRFGKLLARQSVPSPLSNLTPLAYFTTDYITRHYFIRPISGLYQTSCQSSPIFLLFLLFMFRNYFRLLPQSAQSSFPFIYLFNACAVIACGYQQMTAFETLHSVSISQQQISLNILATKCHASNVLGERYTSQKSTYRHINNILGQVQRIGQYLGEVRRIGQHLSISIYNPLQDTSKESDNLLVLLVYPQLNQSKVRDKLRISSMITRFPLTSAKKVNFDKST